LEICQLLSEKSSFVDRADLAGIAGASAIAAEMGEIAAIVAVAEASEAIMKACRPTGDFHSLGGGSSSYLD